MTMNRTTRTLRFAIAILTTAACSTVSMSVIPLVTISEAHAGNGEGNGGGNGGGGNGGGRGGGNGGGNGGGSGGGHGGGSGGGNGGGHGGGSGGGNTGHANGHGAVAAELGGMNAAHASERAMERAAPNSKVGALADYRDAVEAEMELGATLTEAHDSVASDFEDALDGIADLGEEAISELGSLLGIEDHSDASK